MNTLIELTVSGVMSGSLYALMALCIIIVYKSTKVFNFALGYIMLLCGFISWQMLQLPIPIWIGIPAALALSCLLGFLIERLIMRPLIGQPLIASMLVTLALSILLTGIITLVWSTHTRHFEVPIIPLSALSVGNIYISGPLLSTFLVMLVVFVILTIFYQRSSTGLSMRATAENHLLAQATGIRVTRVFGTSWAIMGVVACLAAILIGQRLGLSGDTPIMAFKVFPVILLGGLESIPGAIVGGIIIGLAETYTSGYISSLFAEIVPYIILLIILMIRPEGLWGLKRIERI